MNNVTLEVSPRVYSTKNELSRMRKSGEVPAVLYGRHVDKNICLSFNSRNFSKLLAVSGRTSLISLKSDDSTLNGRSALIKEIQKDCLSDMFLHVDLLEVTQGEKLHTTVTLEFIGVPVGIKEGGIVDIQRRELKIECFPQDIPEHINIDISKMELNDVIHVSDLLLPAGVESLEEDDISVVSVRVVREKVVVEEEGAIAEPIVLTEAAAAERATAAPAADKAKKEK